MARKDLNVGLVGYGFMGRTHSNAFLQAPRFFDLPYRPVLKAVCARNADRVKRIRRELGLPVDRNRLAGPDAAQRHRPHRYREPQRHSRRDRDSRRKGGKDGAVRSRWGEPLQKARPCRRRRVCQVPNMVWYNYRRVPALVLLKELLDQADFGRIFHYRSQFLQDWTISQDLPQGGEGLWRLDASVSGSGVTGDLLAHNIDMALWLNGPITEVRR